VSKYELELFVDYFQFYIQDDNPDVGDLSDAWTEEAVENLLAVSNGVVGIGTARNMDVLVEVFVQDTRPNLNESDFDKINTAVIECLTGKLVVAGCTDYFPDAKRIAVTPGTYNVTIGYKNLKDLSDDGLDGNDSYHIWLHAE
jgi:hypothetical protein